MRIVQTFIFLVSILAFSQQEKKLSHFVNLKEYDKNFVYDIKYATKDNFLKEPIYNCAKCYLLPEVAQALARANNYFCDLGYQIKIFDCYRPLSAQKKMWEIYPNPRYVANPYTKKSVHNRGAAVDLTLINIKTGKQVDMGTSYDYFGKEAHQDYKDLAPEILTNRKILRKGLEKFGFNIIRTEWWHYDYGNAYGYRVYDIELNCN